MEDSGSRGVEMGMHLTATEYGSVRSDHTTGVRPEMQWAMIFDVDGVIADTEVLNARASVLMFEQLYSTRVQPEDFREFVVEYDRRFIDLIHDAGGYAWIHCHGKVRDFIDRFARMGCDMLNPIEPPPMGDLSLREAFSLAGGRMALEGNIEIGDIMTASPDCSET